MLAQSLLIALAVASPAQRGAEVDKDQIAQAVAESFPAHDTNGNGRLSRAEFDAWMLALKAKSDPKLKPNAPTTRAWLAELFDRADADGNAAVTPAEFAQFLRAQSSQPQSLRAEPVRRAKP